MSTETLSSSNDRTGRIFSHRSLEGNWYEDRCQNNQGSHVGVKGDLSFHEQYHVHLMRNQETDISLHNDEGLHPIPRRSRYAHVDSRRTIADYGYRNTTTSHMEMYEAADPVKVPAGKQPQLNAHNFTEGCKDRSCAEKSESGFGSVVPHHEDTHENTYFQTTMRESFSKREPSSSPTAGFPVGCLTGDNRTNNTGNFNRSSYISAFYDISSSTKRLDMMDGTVEFPQNTSYRRTHNGERFDRATTISRPSADVSLLSGERVWNG